LEPVPPERASVPAPVPGLVLVLGPVPVLEPERVPAVEAEPLPQRVPAVEAKPRSLSVPVPVREPERVQAARLR
jgi:hypothetical protein